MLVGCVESTTLGVMFPAAKAVAPMPPTNNAEPTTANAVRFNRMWM
jgi:hypothetical protein